MERRRLSGDGRRGRKRGKGRGFGILNWIREIGMGWDWEDNGRGRCEEGSLVGKELFVAFVDTSIYMCLNI